MTTPTEILQSITDAWAKQVGGKIKVRLSLAVESGPDASPPYYVATIGETGNGWAAASGQCDTAREESERRWKQDGAPETKQDVEKAKLRGKAAELGLRIVEDV